MLGLFVFVSVAVLFFLSFMLPDHYHPWTYFYQDFCAVLALVFLVFWFVLVRRRLYVSKYFLVVVLVACIPMVQLFYGIVYFFGDAFLVSVYLVVFFVSVCIGGQVFYEDRFEGRLIVAWFSMLVLFAVLSTWASFLQWFQLPSGGFVADLLGGGRPFANFSQPNNFSTLNLMGLAGVIYLFESRRIGWLGSLVLAVFIVFGVVLAQSRTAWVCLFLFVMFWALRRRRLNFRLSFRCLLGVVFGYFCLVFFLADIARFFGLESVGFSGRDDGSARINLWSQMLFAVGKAGLVGFGWNQVSVAQFFVTVEHPLQLMTEHSHNLFVDLVGRSGVVVGSGISLLLVLWVGRMALCSVRLESFFLLAAAGAVLVHSMFEFPVEYAVFLIPVGLMLGYVHAEVFGGGERFFSRFFSLPMFFVFLFLMAFVFKEYRVLQEDYRLLRFESAKIGLSKVRSEEMSPDVVIFDQLSMLLRLGRTPLESVLGEAELVNMRKLVSRYPYPWSLLRYSIICYSSGAYYEAGYALLVIRYLYGEDLYFQALDAFSKSLGEF